jgi:hypothetical protein
MLLSPEGIGMRISCRAEREWPNMDEKELNSRVGIGMRICC